MKKILLSLILVVMMLSGTVVFSACKKDEGYQLSNLGSDFWSISNDRIYFKKKELIEGNKIVLELDYETAGYFQSKPYSYLKDYNTLFENSLAFTFAYVDVCSNNNISADANKRNRLKIKVDELSVSMHEVDTNLKSFIDTVKFIGAEPTEEAVVVSLERFRNVLNAYSGLLTKTTNLNNALIDLYYNHALNNPNPNVFGSYNDFNASTITENLSSRLKSQISNITSAFIEVNIDRDLPKELVDSSTGYGNLDLTDYRSEIIKINVNIDVNSATEIFNSKKSKFYELSVEAYNAQETLKNNKAAFDYACSTINYRNITENSQSRDKICKNIIDAQTLYLSEYTNILHEMLNLL